MSRLIKLILSSAFVALLLPIQTHARVGETQGTLESRVVGTGGALRYPQDEVHPRISNDEPNYKQISHILTFKYEPQPHHSSETQKRITSMADAIKAINDQISHLLYYKPHNKAKASRSDITAKEVMVRGKMKKVFKANDGWQLYVILHNGKSVYESYRKTGAPATEKEKNNLLLLNGGNATWKKSENLEEQVEDSFFNATLFCPDKNLRANYTSKGICIYNAGFDAKLFKINKSLKDIKVKAEEANVGTSLFGF